MYLGVKDTCIDVTYTQSDTLLLTALQHSPERKIKRDCRAITQAVHCQSEDKDEL